MTIQLINFGQAEIFQGLFAISKCPPLDLSNMYNNWLMIDMTLTD